MTVANSTITNLLSVSVIYVIFYLVIMHILGRLKFKFNSLSIGSVVLISMVTGFYCFPIVSTLYNLECTTNCDTGCTTDGKLIWKYVDPFVEDEYGVNMVALKDGSLDIAQQIVSCGVQRYSPLMYYIRDHVRYTSRPKKSGKLFRSVNEAYIFTADSVEPLKQRLRQVSVNNPSSKIILVLTGGDSEMAEDILKSGWNEYRVLRIMLITVKNFIVDGVEYGNGLNAAVYDPFVISGSDRGYLFNMIMMEGHSDTDGAQLVRVLSMVMQRVLDNVCQFPLRICMFPYNGSALVDKITENGTVTKYRLKDGEIMHAFVKTINFKPIYYVPEDGFTFGAIDENGTATGSLREIETASADILGNLKPMQNYGQSHADFLFPIDETAFSFLTPKRGYSTSVSFLGIFQLDTSVCLIVTYVVMVTVWYALQAVCRRYFRRYLRRTQQDFHLVEICFVMFGALLLVPQRERQLRHERNLFTTMIVFSMLVCYHYQGKMVELLTSSRKSLDIDTVEELANSDLQIFTVESFSGVLREAAQTITTDVSYRILNERLQLTSDVDGTVKRMVRDKDIAFLLSSYTCKYYTKITYSPVTGEDLLHMTRDGPPTRYSAHLVPKTSPYSGRFNQILLRLRQSGLVAKWRADEIYELELTILKRSQMFYDLDRMGGRIYTMQELWFIFAAWAMCCLFSVLVFLLEIVVYG